MVNQADILRSRILIVDDQEPHVNLLTRVLTESGYVNVSSTMNPESVGDLYREWRHDLILLDLQMPGLDGFQVMEELKAADPTDFLPVIALSAQPGHKLRALQAGAKDIVNKPIDISEVKTRIHNFLEGRSLYRELEIYNQVLEQQLLERTAELSQSEDRYRMLAELAADWYWEQDEHGHFTKMHGPVLEMLGLRGDPESVGAAGSAFDTATRQAGWNEAERAVVRGHIHARQPFLDHAFSRVNPDGSTQRYRVSGEPMFSRSCSYIGYRGIGVEVRAEL